MSPLFFNKMYRLLPSLVSRASLNKIKFSGTQKTLVANMSNIASYETLAVSALQENPYVYHVELNRPDRLNAVNNTMLSDLQKCFDELSTNPECRVVVLSALGKLFTAGIDFKSVMNLAPLLAEQDDVARKAKILAEQIRVFQQGMSSLEICRKPVLAAVHSACIGAGVDLITAADMRYCTKDAYFQVKEVDIGMAADVGTLQRLPKVIRSESLARDLCYTARKLPADEALSCGLVSNVFEDKDSMLQSVFKVAQVIASKSPVAVQATKLSLVYSRDHSVQEGLDHIALYNQMMLQSEDFTNAAVAQATKQPEVVFSKL